MGQKKNLVPMSSPDLDQSDIEAVISTLKTKYLSIGPKIQEFEDMFCKFTGAKHAICASTRQVSSREITSSQPPSHLFRLPM